MIPIWVSYAGCRYGFGGFYNGMSGDAVVLNRKFKDAISLSSGGTINSNPNKFLNAIIQDFNHYIDDLKNKNNTKLLNNFDTMLFCYLSQLP